MNGLSESGQNALMLMFGVMAIIVLIAMYYKRKADRLQDQLDEERTRQKSLSTVYGRISEQWFPLMDRYPYDSQGFRFIGTPVDGIQFEDDRIVFCEFKTNQSSLSTSQRKIRQLVLDGEVYWEEFNFTAE